MDSPSKASQSTGRRTGAPETTEPGTVPSSPSGWWRLNVRFTKRGRRILEVDNQRDVTQTKISVDMPDLLYHGAFGLAVVANRRCFRAEKPACPGRHTAAELGRVKVDDGHCLAVLFSEVAAVPTDAEGDVKRILQSPEILESANWEPIESAGSVIDRLALTTDLTNRIGALKGSVSKRLRSWIRSDWLTATQLTSRFMEDLYDQTNRGIWRELLSATLKNCPDDVSTIMGKILSQNEHDLERSCRIRQDLQELQVCVLIIDYEASISHPQVVSVRWTAIQALLRLGQYRTPPNVSSSVLGRLTEHKTGDFIFLRRGSASRWIPMTKEGINGRSVTSLLHEVFQHTILIIGDPQGIEREVVYDAYLACRHASFTPDQSKDIVCGLNAKQAFRVYRSRKLVNTLEALVNPSIYEFEQQLRTAIERPIAKRLWIIYCGHGSSDGSIQLWDGSYHGGELARLFDKCRLDYYPEVTIGVNSCYAVQFAAQLVGMETSDAIHHFLSFAAVLDSERWESRVGMLTLNEELAYRFIQDVDRGFDTLRQWNKEFWELLRARKERRIGLSRNWHDRIDVRVWPMSFGILDAEGALDVLLRLPSSPGTPESLRTRIASKWPMDKTKCLKALPGRNPPENLVNVESPTLTLFQGKEGDSTLLRWGSAAVLIDGGVICANPQKIKHSEPCYWPLVKDLICLDLVVLTHGDADHCGGLYPLLWGRHFERASVPEIKSFALLAVKCDKQPVSHTKVKEKAKPRTGPGKKTAAKRAPRARDSDKAGFRQANELYYISQDIAITQFNLPLKTLTEPELADVGPFQVIDCGNGNRMEVFVLLPTRQYYDLAEVALRTAGRLTPINRWSLVLVVELSSTAQPPRYLLFTGDAHGGDIADALLHSKWRDVIFDYADMPHHGSKENDPQKFLRQLKTKKLAVSTGGHRFGHPDLEALDAMNQYLDGHTEAKIYFNYSTHIVPERECSRKSPDVKEAFSQANTERLRFPSTNEQHITITL